MSYHQFASIKHLNQPGYSKQFFSKEQSKLYHRKKGLNNSADYMCMPSSKRFNYSSNYTQELFGNQKYGKKNNDYYSNNSHKYYKQQPNYNHNQGQEVTHCLNGRTLFSENNNRAYQDFQLKSNLSKEQLSFNSLNDVMMDNSYTFLPPAQSQRYVNLSNINKEAEKKNWWVLKETASTDSKQGTSLIFDKYDKYNKVDKLDKLDKYDKYNSLLCKYDQLNKNNKHGIGKYDKYQKYNKLLDKLDRRQNKRQTPSYISPPPSSHSYISYYPNKTNVPSYSYQAENIQSNKFKKKSNFQTHTQNQYAQHKKNLLLLKNFRIIQKIGQGKSGKVFKCIDKLTGAIMAMKVINKQQIKKTKMLEQLIRQLKIQAILNHPNIAKLYGFFHDRDNFYILTQLGCDGQLYNLMKDGIPIPQQQVSYTINNLLRALEYMHNHKILHRDIKPQNIVLVHGCIKLCDFGWAVSNDNQLRSTICGTPLYLSPQLINQIPYDQKSDIWAVGILAFQMVTGKTPFNITNRQQLLKIVTSQIEFPQDLHLSQEFKNFMRQILQKDPKKRLSCRQLKKLPFIRKYKEYDSSQATSSSSK